MQKRHLVLSLPLAAVLSVSGLAQTSAPAAPASQSTDQTQLQSSPAPTTAPSDNAQADPNLQPLSLEQHEGFWGKINPFARKKYVRKQLSPIVDRTNELDELTAANSKMIRDVDSRSQEGIRLASLKANEADTHAVDATNRANQANETATQANTRLQSVEKVVTNIDQYQRVQDTEILFRPGHTVLSKKAKAALDDLATPLKSQKGYVVEVQGFSSARGQAGIQASQKLAESVVRYLVTQHDVPVYRIYTLGMGNAPVQSADGTSKTRRLRGSRVEISLLHNDLGDLEQANAAPAQSNLPQSDAPVVPAKNVPNNNVPKK